MNRYKLARIFLVLCTAAVMFGAETTTKTSDTLITDVNANAQIAMSMPGYPVTAGDIYTLAYAAGSSTVSYTILVDSSYKVRVSNLAVLDATGKTYLDLKTQVEAVVSKNYPLSGVQFVLVTPAAFTVTVKGEVLVTAEKTAWALSRLSSVVTPSLTPYASTRDITITSASGKTRTVDLWKAQRTGDLAEDPYVRPGDVVTVSRFARSVTIAGAVERPGTYQLLPGEGLAELVGVYASGFTPVADKNRLELVRYVDAKTASGSKVFLTAADLASNYALNNFDAITIPAVTDLVPVMFVEGAVGPKVPANTETGTREIVKFNKGENYASLVRRNRAWFTSVSDTAGAYIIRQGQQIPLNLNPMLYDTAYASSMEVEENDTLFVPFRQYFVSVSGAVLRPGRYPYIQYRDWNYYIALAGGFDTTRNSFASVKITDISGKRRNKTDPITPETVIDASTNTIRYYFGQYSPVIVTSLAIIVSYYTVRDILAAQAAK